MFISLVGLPSAGKNSVLEYLVQNFGFAPLFLAESDADEDRIEALVGRLSLNRSLEVGVGFESHDMSADSLPRSTRSPTPTTCSTT